MPRTDLVSTEICMPEDSGRPAVITASSWGDAKYTLVIVDCESFNRVDKKYKTPGVYVLLSYIDQKAKSYKAYVGRSMAESTGVYGRIKLHDKDGDKDWWRRAILVSGIGRLPDAVIKKLEYDLIQELRLSRHARVFNGNSANKAKLLKREIPEATHIKGTIIATLQTFGYKMELEDKAEPEEVTLSDAPNTKQLTRRAVKLSDLFSDAEAEEVFLLAGDKLKFKSKSYQPEITVTAKGELRVKGVPGKTFDTPGKAFMAYQEFVFGRTPTNSGYPWSRWIVETEDKDYGDEGLLDLRARYCKYHGIKD